MKKLLFACLLPTLLGACSQDSDNIPEIAEGPVRAMEKAKGVEQVLSQQAEDQLEQIDAQTQADAEGEASEPRQ